MGSLEVGVLCVDLHDLPLHLVDQHLRRIVDEVLSRERERMKYKHSSEHGARHGAVEGAQFNSKARSRNARTLSVSFALTKVLLPTLMAQSSKSSIRLWIFPQESWHT